MRITVHDSISEIGADDWNSVAGDRFPFMRYEFLHAAERTGSVSLDEGWQPRHLVARHDDGSIRAALPLYEKHHSWGEFVFDWAWAQAYERAGLNYYPKLVSTVPFTPATSTKLLRKNPDDTEIGGVLLDAAIALAGELDCSSVHILFPEQEENGLMEQAGFLTRKDCQFHWRNRNYRDFDEFLATFSSAKRKKARRDRRRVSESGIRFRRLSGAELTAQLWETVYDLISRTFMRRGSLPYFRREFFSEISRLLPENILVVLAESGDKAVAAAVFFVSEEALYGRYWGSTGHFNALHFETCYFQGIDYCIEHNISRFEPGTQGEHKVSRGFTPATTWSCHWLAQPAFLAAIDDYLNEEGQHVERYMQAVDEHSPYRKDGN